MKKVFISNVHTEEPLVMPNVFDPVDNKEQEANTNAGEEAPLIAPDWS